MKNIFYLNRVTNAYLFGFMLFICLSSLLFYLKIGITEQSTLIIIMTLFSITFIRALQATRYKVKYEIDESITFPDIAPIDVVVPYYNEQPEKLKENIDSILKQTLPVKKIIIIDDGSGSNECAQFAKQFSELNQDKVTFVQLEHNCGKANAISEGLKFSDSEYLIVLDSDSTIEQDAVKNIFRRMLSVSDCSAVCGNLRVADKNINNLLSRIVSFMYLSSFEIGRSAQAETGSVIVASGAFSIYKSDIYKASLKKLKNQYIFGHQLKIGEDRYHTLSALIKGRVSFAIDAICYTDPVSSYYAFFKQQLRWSRSNILISVLSIGKLKIFGHLKMGDVPLAVFGQFLSCGLFTFF